MNVQVTIKVFHEDGSLMVRDRVELPFPISTTAPTKEFISDLVSAVKEVTYDSVARIVGGIDAYVAEPTP